MGRSEYSALADFFIFFFLNFLFLTFKVLYLSLILLI